MVVKLIVYCVLCGQNAPHASLLSNTNRSLTVQINYHTFAFRYLNHRGRDNLVVERKIYIAK